MQEIQEGLSERLENKTFSQGKSELREEINTKSKETMPEMKRPHQDRFDDKKTLK